MAPAEWPAYYTAMTHEQTTADFIAWCLKERADAVDGVEAIEMRHMKLFSQSEGAPMTDITPSHLANFRRIIADMDRLIAEH